MDHHNNNRKHGEYLKPKPLLVYELPTHFIPVRIRIGKGILDLAR